MMRDWHSDVMHPDPSTPAGQRKMLAERYRHAALTFTEPSAASPWFAATWDSGKVEADTEDELLRTLLEELQDCGTERHDWITVTEARDPLSGGTLRTQRLECAYCDARERVITVPDQ